MKETAKAVEMGMLWPSRILSAPTAARTMQNGARKEEEMKNIKHVNTCGALSADRAVRLCSGVARRASTDRMMKADKYTKKLARHNIEAITADTRIVAV